MAQAQMASYLTEVDFMFARHFNYNCSWTTDNKEVPYLEFLKG